MGHEANAVWSIATPSLDRPALIIVAKSMIVARRALHVTLPVEMIHDVALDLLLRLYVADNSQPLKAITFDTSASPTVARRWISALQQAGLVTVTDDTVRLSAFGEEQMILTLQNVAQSQWESGHEI